jgi:branched-chain amino acid aminotransferase
VVSERQIWFGEGLSSTPALDARDRGFTLGDGLFETIRAVYGRTPLLALHLARLRGGAQVIGLDLRWDDDYLADAVAAVLSANLLTDAAVRLTVSRGVPTQRGLLPDPNAAPSLVIDATPFAGYPDALYRAGATAVTSAIRRDERSPLCGLKSLSRLDSVLARRSAADAGADEAVLLNTVGRIAGASAANLFVLRGGLLLTPPLEDGALAGTTRRLLLSELAPALGIATEEGRLDVDGLRGADEAFLSSALLGVVPLTAIDERPIGIGRPGRTTRVLAGAWRRRIGLLDGHA